MISTSWAIAEIIHFSSKDLILIPVI